MIVGVATGVAFVVGAFATRAIARRARQRHTSRVVIANLSGNAAQRVTLRRHPVDLWRSPPKWLVIQIEELQLPVRADEVWRWWRRAGLAAALAGLLLAGPVLAAIALGAVAALPVVAASVMHARAEASYDTNLAQFLDAVGRSIRSGGSIASAIDEAAAVARGAVASDTRRVAAGVQRGQPITRALDSWIRTRERGSVRLAVGALGLAVETGGPPARVIEEVSSALRQRQQLEGEARALAAQARLSALVVGLAPIAFAALTCITDRKNAHLLFGTPIGLACVTVGLILDALGALWMRRISESVRG
ncbi:MAG: tight adherence protein [Actinomycetota bacterium]|jgi:tight adherence protein B